MHWVLMALGSMEMSDLVMERRTALSLHRQVLRSSPVPREAMAPQAKVL